MCSSFAGVFVKKRKKVSLSAGEWFENENHASLVYIVKGSGTVEDCHYQSDSVVLMGYGERLLAEENTKANLLVLKNGTELIRNLKRCHKLIDPERHKRFFADLFAEKEIDENIFKHSAKVYSYIMGLEIQQERKIDTYTELVENAVRIINDEFYILQGVSELSDRLLVTKHHLIREFTAQVKTSPGKYIENIRIERACILLACTSYHMDILAGMLGFANSNYFGKVFKKAVGITPLEYRRANRKKELVSEEKKLIEKLESIIFV